MSEDTMIKRMDKSAFFDSVTWLNQENWQKFFGKSLPNGILVDHALKLDNTGYRIADMMDLKEGENALTIGNGCLMANGLYAEILTPVTVDNVTEAEKTKLIVVRYDSDNSFASIYQKVDVLTEDNISVPNAIRNFVVDESFLCIRNESIYEIPIAFQYYSGGVITMDLRHFVYAPSGMKRVLNLETVASGTDVKLGVLRGNSYAQLIGGTSYTITIKPTDSEEYFDIYPMVINSNEPITLFIRNGSGEIKKLNLKKMFSGLAVGYEWIDGWTENTHGINISMANASTMVIRFDVVKQTVDGTIYSVTTKSLGSGGGVDPVTVYTKAEIENMLAVKANSSDVNRQLAVKENIANLKSLAYKDKVNYETEVTNKPTWNSVAKQYFYVDGNNGNDGNSGDQGSPFKTIQKAIDSVNINSVGEIAIAHGTYLEYIKIDSKNIILKQKDFDDNFIIIAPNVTTENQLEYAFTISDNSIVKIIGNFSIRNSVNCILIDRRSSLFIDGDYTTVIQNENSTITEKKYSVLEVILRYSGENAGLAKWTGHGINIRSGSQLITESLNLVDIKNNYNSQVSANSGYGIFLDKCNICYVYKFQFYGLYDSIYSDQGLLYTRDESSDTVLYKPSGFGTLAYKDDVSNNDKLYVRKNGNWTELKFPDNSDTSILGTLALKDTVDYRTEVTNKPAFGALASKDKVNYRTDVTNTPTFGTLASKNSVDYETEVTNKPAFGTLASKDSVDYWTEVANRPTLGPLASKSSVNYETEVRNKPTLGTLASKDSVDYSIDIINKPTSFDYETEVTNKPTLGTLASKDSVDYETEVTNKPTLGTLATKNNILFQDISNPISSFNIFYVTPSGNDNNDGSQNSPFATIQKAIDSISPLWRGRIYVGSGTYTTGFHITNKVIEFYQSDGGNVNIEGSGGNYHTRQWSIYIGNNSNVAFNSGIWSIKGTANSYGVSGVLCIDNSTVIFKKNFTINDSVEGNMIDILNSGRLIANQTLTLRQQNTHSRGIHVEFGSYAYINKITLNGDYSNSVTYFLEADGGTIMYGSKNHNHHIRSLNGGQILTGETYVE